MAAARAESPGRAEQLDELLRREPWEQVAAFAASVCQGTALDLLPWESAPVDAETLCWEHGRQVVKRDAKAGALLDRMLAAGLSQIRAEPDRGAQGGEGAHGREPHAPGIRYRPKASPAEATGSPVERDRLAPVYRGPPQPSGEPPACNGDHHPQPVRARQHGALRGRQTMHLPGLRKNGRLKRLCAAARPWRRRHSMPRAPSAASSWPCAAGKPARRRFRWRRGHRSPRRCRGRTASRCRTSP